jgi:hypothetical protein
VWATTASFTGPSEVVDDHADNFLDVEAATIDPHVST